MFVFYIAIAVLIADQLSKFLTLKYFSLGESLPIIPNVFHLSYVCNKGLAFGLFSGRNLEHLWIFYVCLIIIIFVHLFYRKLFPGKKSTQVLLALILGGAVGNLIDRIRFGCVIDFLDFRIWPVFNLADSAITIGTLLLIVQMFKQRK